MNLPDLLIIYLACGAPLGVYYFLQHRNKTEMKILILKSFLRFIFWIPFAIQLVARKPLLTKFYNTNFDAKTISDSKREQEIEEIKKSFERSLSRTFPSYSIYEFRETFDRFVGLSLEVQTETVETAPAEKEIFRIANHGNKKIGEVCLNRRNRLRLSFHQKLARRDFLQMFGLILEKADEPQILFNKSLRLADMLNDLEARTGLENLSEEFLQTAEKTRVSNLEQGLWKTAKHKPFTDSKISTNLQVMTVTANSSNKD